MNILSLQGPRPWHGPEYHVCCSHRFFSKPNLIELAQSLRNSFSLFFQKVASLNNFWTCLCSRGHSCSQSLTQGSQGSHSTHALTLSSFHALAPSRSRALNCFVFMPMCFFVFSCTFMFVQMFRHTQPKRMFSSGSHNVRFHGHLCSLGGSRVVPLFWVVPGGGCGAENETTVPEPSVQRAHMFCITPLRSVSPFLPAVRCFELSDTRGTENGLQSCGIYPESCWIQSMSSTSSSSWSTTCWW